jgi:protein SCO1/2
MTRRPNSDHYRIMHGLVKLALLAFTLVLAVAVGTAFGQPFNPRAVPTTGASKRPKELQNVGLKQQLDARIPLDVHFRDDSGKEVTLAQYFGNRPVVLSLVYFECPQLCTYELNGFSRALRALHFQPGREFEAVTVSFNPNEGPALAKDKKEHYVQTLQQPGAASGWHFLTGKEDQIRRLAEAVGFAYQFQPTTGQFAHPSAIMILTPDGRISRYLLGIEYSARDLKLALVEAGGGRIGTKADQVVLYCFHYDPATGKYTLAIMNVLRILALVTIAAMGAFLFVMFRRDFRNKEAY